MIKTVLHAGKDIPKDTIIFASENNIIQKYNM